MIDAAVIFEPTTGRAITVSAVSTNVIDMLGRYNFGAGDYLDLNVQVLVGFSAAGAATLLIEYQVSNDNAAWATTLSSPVYPVATLLSGAQLLAYKVPNSQLLGTGNPRYARLNYTVATGPMTAGTIAAWISAGKWGA